MSINGFDERLINARREKGFTQEVFAARLGVTPQAVSKWERSTSYPDIVLFGSICDILDCSMDYLLSGKQPELKLSENNNDSAKERLLKILIADPLVIEVGAGFIDLLMEENENGFKEVQKLRDKLALEHGVLMPLLRLRDITGLKEYEYRILAYDKLLADRIVEASEEMDFKQILDHLEEICLKNYSKIINRQTVKTLIDNLKEQYPAVVQGVIPDKISLMQLQEILSSVIEKGGSIHNLIKIIEVLEQETERTKDSSELVQCVMNYIQQ